MRKRTQETAPWNAPAPETGTSFLASRPFAVQTKSDAAAIPGQSENHTFVQHKLESLGLQLKAKQGTITPAEQTQLGVLQAKMNDFWVQRSQQSAQLGYNAAHIPIHRPDTPTPVQPKLILRSPQSSAPSTPQSLQRKLRTAIPAAPIQAKLTIGAPGDKYEQEADQVAQRVIQRLHSPTQDDSQAQPTLQRKSHPEEEELQTRLQRKPQLPEVDSGEADPDLESSIQRARSSGQPLAPKLQRQMGQAMGADFSGVKVHTDANASQLNQSIQAKAFTTGQDIFFKGGEYKPESRSGQELIAHELTHVVQQNGTAIQRSPQDSSNHSEPPNPQLPITNLLQRQQSSSSMTTIQLKRQKKRLDFVVMKRKKTHIGQKLKEMAGLIPKAHDPYGHWWTELGALNSGNQWEPHNSYGWWPSQQVNVKQTFQGVPGVLNKNLANDPHHGHNADEEFHPAVEVDDQKDYDQIRDEVTQSIRSFATNFHGSWNWRLGWGKNCHTFQEKMMKRLGLQKSESKSLLRDPAVVQEMDQRQKDQEEAEHRAAAEEEALRPKTAQEYLTVPERFPFKWINDPEALEPGNEKFALSYKPVKIGLTGREEQTEAGTYLQAINEQSKHIWISQELIDHLRQHQPAQ